MPPTTTRRRATRAARTSRTPEPRQRRVVPDDTLRSFQGRYCTYCEQPIEDEWQQEHGYRIEGDAYDDNFYRAEDVSPTTVLVCPQCDGYFALDDDDLPPVETWWVCDDCDTNSTDHDEMLDPEYHYCADSWEIVEEPEPGTLASLPLPDEHPLASLEHADPDNDCLALHICISVANKNRERALLSELKRLIASTEGVVDVRPVEGF